MGCCLHEGGFPNEPASLELPLQSLWGRSESSGSSLEIRVLLPCLLKFMNVAKGDTKESRREVEQKGGAKAETDSS